MSECISLAKAYEAKLGYGPVADVDFAKDVQAGIDSRRDPFEPPSWDYSSTPVLRSRRNGKSAALSGVSASFSFRYPPWHRAKTPEAALNRRRYLDEVLALIPVEPFTREMGVLAAKVNADMRRTGLVIATADLLIGITALHYSYAIGTRSVRHFQMIPGLQVVPL